MDQPTSKDILIQEAVYAADERLAQETAEALKRDGILSINLLGAPGVGKTSTLLKVMEKLNDWKFYVLEGDIESDIDTQTLQKLGVSSYQINTHGACHLEADVIASSLEHLNIDTTKPGALVIENIGNLVCPAEFVIGEHLKLLIVSVTDGSDKPYKYPLAFEKADAIILNKNDLRPYLDFDETFFTKGVRALNPTAPIFPVSATRNEGIEALCAWLQQKRDALIREA